MELVLAVDGNPDPHGWYFTAPTFEDHPVQGWWTNDSIVLDEKSGNRLSLKYMREHSSAKPGEPLSLYVITTPRELVAAVRGTTADSRNDLYARPFGKRPPVQLRRE